MVKNSKRHCVGNPSLQQYHHQQNYTKNVTLQEINVTVP